MCRYVRVCGGVRGCERVCTGMRRYTWVYMGVSGHTWVCLSVRRCAWVCVGVHDCAWVREGMRGYVWACAGMHVCAHVCAGVCGCVWDKFSEYLLETRFLTSASFAIFLENALKQNKNLSKKLLYIALYFFIFSPPRAEVPSLGNCYLFSRQSTNMIATTSSIAS